DRAPEKPGSGSSSRDVPSSPTPPTAPSGPGAGSAPTPDQNALRVLKEQEVLTAVTLANVQARRFQFTIDPKTPVRDLLPIPPASKHSPTPSIAKTLTEVPEIQFQMPLDKKLTNEEAIRQTAHTMAKINHLNDKNQDGFMTALRHERIDLAGL